MNSQAFAKAVFLIFVLVIAGYIMYTNNNVSLESFEDMPAPPSPPTTPPTQPTQSTQSTQSTSPPQPTPSTEPTPPTQPAPVSNPVETQQPVTQPPTVEKSTAQKIKEVYKELYGADPRPEEVNFYVNFFRDRETSLAYMKEIISTSAPTLQKTLKAGVQQLIPDMPIGTEDEVIAIFNQILERHPGTEELQYYSNFIKQGPANVEKMKVLLLQSSEYKRLQQLQDNKAHGFLLGGITDRQLTMMVNSVYTQVGGNADNLDEDTHKFLKKKYLEYQLNEPVFKKFLQDFIMYDSKAKVSTTSQPSQPSQTTPPTQQTQPSSASALHANAGVTGQLAQSSFVPTSTPQQKPSQPSTMPSREAYANQCQVDTQAMINKIKQDADCQFNKNQLEDKYRSNRETSMAKTVHDRNREELKNICERNKSFAQYHDEDMVLIPGQEWSVPQKHTPACYGRDSAYNPMIEQTALIGTLLNDAKDTQIGSIMPKFTYKEHTN